MYEASRTIKSLLLTVICFLIVLTQTTTEATNDKFNVSPSSKSAFSPSSISTEVDFQTIPHAFNDKVGSSTNDRQNELRYLLRIKKRTL